MRKPILFSLVALVALSLGVAPFADRASAQYFGRNKVQYEDFDWQVLETEHFDIYHYEAERDAAVMAGRMAERWYARLSRILDHELNGRQPIVLYGDHPAFEQTNTTFSQIDESTGGLTEPLKRRIVLPLGATLQESDHVLGHELVHAFQFDVAGIRSEGVSNPAALRAPLWFIEGMAEYLSIGSRDPFTGMWMRGAIQDTALPDWGDLSNQRRYFPYRYGHAFWSYVGGRFGDDAVGQLLEAGIRGRNLKQVFGRVLGVHPDTLVADWHAALEDTQGPVLEAAAGTDEVGRELLSEEKSGTRQNLGPSLSPDGELMVFASEQNLFSIELFVADAETGEVLRKLTETARDPHFESLQWLSSTGAWSPDGTRFALGAVTKGTPVVAIFDPRNGEKVREVRVPQAGEIFNPTWAPDGTRIAFSAQVNGFTDLFVLDLESGEVRRITDDRFSDVHPAWAPDGSGIVEVTDRFGNEVDQLQFRDLRLAVVDPATGEREELPGFDSGKHINPQFGPDGRSIYFVSDQDGVSDLYRLDRRTGEIHRLTHLKTGISGISALSPALSVARNAEKAAITVHGKGSFFFDVYTLEGEETLAGEPVADEGEGPLAGLDPALLPPEERSLDRVDRLLADADLGLADPVTFETRDYSPSLSLDFIGRPNLQVGTNEFGFFAGGGGSAFFSDMLGDRNLMTLAQISSSGGQPLYSSAAFATYLDQGGRWNWGFQAGQVPLIDQFARGFINAPVEEGGQQESVAWSNIRFWQIDRQITGVLQYPFHRSLRAEFTAGARNIDFASKERLLFVNSRRQVVETRDRDFTPLDTISSLTTATASGALVYDNAVFGATAPMVGQRYRLEVSPRVGNVFYTRALADYRKYFMPVQPFTLAFRGMHIGRYGSDSEDFRLGDFFLGRQGLVRGYRFGFGDFSQCGGVGQSFRCQDTDLLTGSRIAVFNAEARLPFLGGIGIVRAPGFPPIDLLAFFDAGSAWNGDVSGEPAGPFEAEQDPDVQAFDEIFRSTGVGARINLFGLAIFEVDYAYAFDRVNPDTGEDGDWVWELNVTPGF
jgi:Tol biopolymer transport system component